MTLPRRTPPRASESSLGAGDEDWTGLLFGVSWPQEAVLPLYGVMPSHIPSFWCAEVSTLRNSSLPYLFPTQLSRLTRPLFADQRRREGLTSRCESEGAVLTLAVSSPLSQ